MDERLEKALDFSNYIQTLNNQKDLLKQSFDQSITYYFSGGTFTITLDLLNYLNFLNLEKVESAILIDNNGIPVCVSVNDFYNNIKNIYKSSLQQYYEDYNKLIKSRTIESIINL